jgi:hypothetical protein
MTEQNTESAAATADTAKSGEAQAAEATQGNTATSEAAVETASTEQQTDDTSSSLLGEAQQKQAAQEAEQAEVVPDSYELEVPEGLGFDKGSAVRDVFEEKAREIGLSQDKAAKLLPPVVSALQEQHKATVKGWSDQARVDAEIGGQKLEETLRLGNLALDNLPGGQEVRQMLDASGYGNHPKWLAFLRATGALVPQSDRLVTGTTPKPAQPPSSRFPNRGKLNP